MSTLAGYPQSAKILGKENTDVTLVYQTRGINTFTIILKAISVIVQAVSGSFNDQSYTISVSHNGSYFIKLRDVKMGSGNIISNSFTYGNQMWYGSPLYYEFVKISVLALGENIESRVLISAR